MGRINYHMTDNKISPFQGNADGDIEMHRRAPSTDPAQVDSSRVNLLAKSAADVGGGRSLAAPPS